MSPAETRILAALRSRPMTVNQIADHVFVEPSYLRHLLRRLSDSGVVRQGGSATRDGMVKGATPRYWERVA
jgi:DNA-binding MarR family transcriptional regulator